MDRAYRSSMKTAVVARLVTAQLVLTRDELLASVPAALVLVAAGLKVLPGCVSRSEQSAKRTPSYSRQTWMIWCAKHV